MDTAVWKPGWLPTRFDKTLAGLDYVLGPDWRYSATYRAAPQEFVSFTLGAINTGQPQSREEITIRGTAATVAISDQAPRIQLFWREGPRLFTIFSNSLSRDEIVRIATELLAVTR